MASPDIILQAITSGVATGAIYALVAVGLTLVFGVLRLINFAHGEFLMLAMYGGYFAWVTLGLDPVISVFAMTPLLALAGVILYQLLFRHVFAVPEINQMAVTLGVSLLLQNLALILFRADSRFLDMPRSSKSVGIGHIIVQMPHLLAATASVVVIVILYLVLRKTRFGVMMRAVSESRDGAALSGINLDAVYRGALALGIGILGVAGPLLVAVLYVDPTVGALFTLKAFAIVILGGVGSFGGCLIGALIVGLGESIAGIWLPGSIAAAVPFALLILIMLVRPQGLVSFAGRRA